nr:hypothetical protein [Tanacetum cinerariifolium]
EAGINFDEEHNDLLLDDVPQNEELEELNALYIMMARIQTVANDSDVEPSYDSDFVDEVLLGLSVIDYKKVLVVRFLIDKVVVGYQLLKGSWVDFYFDKGTEGKDSEVLVKAQTKAELNKKAHNAMILCLANIEVNFKDEDLVLLLLTSLLASYEHFVDTLIYKREALTLEDVMDTLNSKEIKERSKAKGDDSEGLYVRGKTDRRDSCQSRGKSRLKSQGYVKKDDKPSSSGLTCDDSEVMMVMRVEALLDWIMDSRCSYHMTPRFIPELKRNLISMGTLEKEGYTVKLQSGKVKWQVSLLVVLKKKTSLHRFGTKDWDISASQDYGCWKSRAVWHTTQRVIYYVHSDLWGLSQVDSLGDNQTGRTVKKLRTINGLEFYNRKFEQLCVESGITRHLTVSWMAYQNRLAERIDRTLMDKVRCLLIQSGLPKTFWTEATCTTAYLINMSPSTSIEKNTPIEMWSGHPSDYGMLRIFGCVTYPHDKQGKLKPREVKCVLLSYPEGVKGYRLYRLDNETPKIVTSRNVVFNESVMYKDTLKDSGTSANKSVEELQVEVELQRLNNHKPKEDQIDLEDIDDEDAGDQETDQTLDLTDYQLALDREPRIRKKPLRKDGFSEEEQDLGISRSSSWAKAVQHASIRVILALTTCKDYELEQLDVKTTFLYGNLEEVIYTRQPLGYEQDDMLIAYKSKIEIGSTKSFLKKEFDMKELWEAKKILGMEIVKDRSHKIMKVSQSGYVSKILNNFRIDNGKSVKMPLGEHFQLSLKDFSVKDCDVERMSKVPYANAVGSLMYLMVCTRPDIAYAVNVVSRYLANLGKIIRK